MSLTLKLDLDKLRGAIQAEYAEVASSPDKGFHFHTGRPLARLLGYPEAETDPLPESVIESFAGVGNPFVFGALRPVEVVVEVGSGAGFDAVLAARQVGPSGRVIGVDMTPAMLEKARANAAKLGLGNVEFRQGYMEELPVEDGAADVVISNGVINLSPDKETVFREIARVLKPGGRLQIADIVVQKAVPDAAKENIDLWTG
ncbi:MAG TPA: methyltransferase domain-containing protein [Dehalococcoidia bacterium]|nr:methyltransferase domain-containing protein [Dehalococcoidia bacterium]